MNRFLNVLPRAFPVWRERGWTRISPDAYRAAWERWGGSVATNPAVVARLSALAGIDVDYFGAVVDGQTQAAIPAWGRHLALARTVLKREKKRDLFDLGNAEIILPQAPGVRIFLRHRARYVSALHAEQIVTLHRQRETLMLARPPERYGKKFHYNQRRELRLLESEGGHIEPVSAVSSDALAGIYENLFEKRWGFSVPGKARLTEVFTLLRDYMSGSLIRIRGEPVAVQILYRVESPGWISVEYINGGVDPAWNHLSPGSVLTFVNIRNEWTHARLRGKPLRYSFGRADREYKARWCEPVPVYET